MAPRVSIIIPAYNGAHLLPDALESVLAQSYGDWEAIVVDDASPDDVHDVALSFAARDPRVKAIRLDRNQGIGGARNAGVKASSGGELLCLLDQDDYWYEDYLERSVALYDAAKAAGSRPGIVSANAHVLTPDGIADGTYMDRNGFLDPVPLDAMLRKNHLLARAIISREAWEQAGGGFSPECRGSDDYDLWLRIMELGYDARAIEEPLVVYREHVGSTSKDHLEMSRGIIACYERALDRGNLNPEQRRRAKAQIRHFRALRERELVYRAVAERKPLRAAGRALRAAPYGIAAFAQDRSRWGEWARDLRRPGSNMGRVQTVVERSKR
jgi:glycosyltransferase involved in cell wall biosynthesis